MKNNYLFFLLPVFLSGCGKSGKTNQTPETITILAEHTPNDYVGTILVYYENEFGDSRNVHFQKNSATGHYFPQKIKTRHPIWLRFTRGAQVPVYLVPGDTLQVKAAPRFNVDYTLVGERPGEISFYNLLDQKSLGMNFSDLAGVHKDETVFRPRTKMLNYLYNQRQAFLKQVKDSLALGPGFDKFIQTETKSNYLISLLAPFYHPNFNRQLLRHTYLDTLSQFYTSGFFNQDSLVFSSLRYRRSITFYNRFLSRAALQTPQEMQVLYRNASQKFTGQTRDYALFSLLKEHLPQDLGMTAYLERSKKDITYKPYRIYLDSLVNRPLQLTTNPKLLNNALTTVKGEKITWQELLARNQGKVVYVTFWATWFDLSLNELVAAQALQATLKDQDIVFVYLAENHPKEKAQLQPTITARQINKENDQHYFIDLESPMPVFIAGNNNGFPMLHHLLIDKTGKVAAMNAKDPGNPKLREDIITLLDKN